MAQQRVSGSGPLAPPCIWVVDDDAEIRNLLVEGLMKRGLRCPRQFSSAEALLEAAAHASAPDVIILDIHMDGMSGLDALRQLKQLIPAARVFIWTSCYDSFLEETAWRKGASGFLLKRDDLQSIISCLTNPAGQWLPSGRIIPATGASAADELAVEMAGRFIS